MDLARYTALFLSDSRDHLLEEEFGREAEIVRADLLDEGEKVRHSPDKLARVILACYEKARARASRTTATTAAR